MVAANTGGLAMGDGAGVVLGPAPWGRGQVYCTSPDTHLVLQVFVPELERAFLFCPGVDPVLVPEGWVQNHYRSALLQAVSTVHPTSCCCR